MVEQDIYSLVEKYMRNRISPDELIVLDKLLEKDKNVKIFKSLIQNNYQLRTKNISFDSGEQLKRAEARIKNLESDKRIQRKHFYRYAIAASVIIVVALTIYLNGENKESQFVEPVIVNTDIQPGTDRAILTLEDGSHIALEKGKTFQKQNVSSNGKELIYKANPGKEEKIAHNLLTVPRGGQYHIVLADGTEVWLNSESKLKFPTTFKEGQDRIVELINGEAYFDVSPSDSHNGSKFRVVNTSQEVEVLGTEFNIKAYNDESIIYTTLLEGKVRVTNSDVMRNLIPDQQSILNIETKDVKIVTVDAASETSWRRGVFSFKGKPLKDVMKVISRWYDVDVVFTNKKLESLKFNGSLNKDRSIERILSLMLSTNIESYEIKGKTIILR